ncbi:helix-turn-helix transcriptional regulator [Roseibium sp.]|uniref:helix-turn-helix transcriptional regulator n=1 Tax=Roseibium sp. TaxID=1936156 RepID=UPI003A971A12
MPRLHLESLFAKIYSAALLDGGLSQVVAEIATAYPTLPVTYQAQCVYRNTLYDSAIFNHGPNAVENLIKAESANPFPPIALTCDPSDIVKTKDTIAPDEVEKLDFYHEFLRDHGNINRATGIILHRHGVDTAFIAANFPKEFSERDEEGINALLRQLRPHLQGAFKLLLEVKAREIQAQNHEIWLEQIPTAAIIVDPTLKILQMNSIAETTLPDHPVLTASGITRQLGARSLAARRQIEHAIGRAYEFATPVGPVEIQEPEFGSGLLFAIPIAKKTDISLTLEPFLTPRLPILVTYFSSQDKPRRAHEILSATLGISKRESELVQELIAGCTLRDATDRLGISYNTGRNQLASAQSKAGCRSQTDLVRKATQILARLPNTAVDK